MGPIHLVGHSYGGAIAFTKNCDLFPPLASRVRSLTLIEPVLPTILLENGSERDEAAPSISFIEQTRFAKIFGRNRSWEAIEKFLAFWKGSGPEEKLSSNALVRMIEHAEKLAFDFTAILAEQNGTSAAAAMRVPTLLISGGLSPYLTQRVTGRLASTIADAQTA